MSSAPIDIHGVNSAPGRASVSTHGRGPRKAASAESPATMPSAMPPPNAADETTNCRRLIIGIVPIAASSGFRSGGGLMDRRPHAGIGAAPADVIDVSVDILVGRVGDDADPSTPLLWVLRDHLGMTGTKYGCGIARCGACTVHIDGNPTRSCQVPLQSTAGASVTTIEGLSQDCSHP